MFVKKIRPAKIWSMLAPLGIALGMLLGIATPSSASTAVAGYNLQLQGVHLFVQDDDGGSDTKLHHFPLLPIKWVAPSQNATWEFGGCSGGHDNGEVWVQVTVVATYLDQTKYKVQTFMDLYDDTSSACENAQVNFPLGDLDLDGQSSRLDIQDVGTAQPASPRMDVHNTEEGVPDDLGYLWMGYNTVS